ncbi:microcin immunity protein MccF [Marinomonas sp. MED121]|uniref:microcin immunity protein MccF n=1 Tax=Marinomonas sp. MED121 TaxID=314277 RepID=UPI00006901A4|nr:microcin immunity protein MccF [Marinomonas sp. MED121]EAQ64394.1 microcin immunity protein MccF [Marinomonas sp. MED121]
MPEIKQGDILLIEDALLSSPQIERSFNHLKLCGVFDKVKAIILGKHELFDDKGSKKQPIDHLLEVLGDKPLPILYDFDACHTHPMLIMPIGTQVEIDFDTKSINIVSPWLS